MVLGRDRSAPKVINRCGSLVSIISQFCYMRSNHCPELWPSVKQCLTVRKKKFTKRHAALMVSGVVRVMLTQLAGGFYVDMDNYPTSHTAEFMRQVFCVCVCVCFVCVCVCVCFVCVLCACACACACAANSPWYTQTVKNDRPLYRRDTYKQCKQHAKSPDPHKVCNGECCLYLRLQIQLQMNIILT